MESRAPGETVYIVNRNFPGLPALAVPFILFPGLAGLFVAFHPENTVDGRRVYFIERRPTVIETFRRGLRTGDLFLPSAPAPTRPIPNSRFQIPK
jgi:hypothetical protein